LNMEQTKYLVVGSSHAALEAVTAIRMHDSEGSLTLLTRDPHLPYSPTVLPYVVSGRSAPDGIFLRDEKFFADHRVQLKRGTALKALHVERNAAELADGSEIAYEKILLATGAAPAIPPIPGLDQVSYHVLRTLDDATKLNAAIRNSKQAVVLGAGLVGMHAAENLVKAGASVTIVEMAKQLTDGYFDATAAGLIEKAFTDNGATILTGSRVVKLAPSAAGALLTLENGTTLEADLLLVATGVKAQHGLPCRQRRRARSGHSGRRRHADQRAQRLVRGRLCPGQGLLHRHQDHERDPARCYRAGPHCRHGHGRRPRHQALSRRRAAQYLSLLRPPCDFRRFEQGARGRRGRHPLRRTDRPLPEGDFQCRQPPDGNLRRQ
jgi:thioredoxin reductase